MIGCFVLDNFICNLQGPAGVTGVGVDDPDMEDSARVQPARFAGKLISRGKAAIGSKPSITNPALLAMSPYVLLLQDAGTIVGKRVHPFHRASIVVQRVDRMIPVGSTEARFRLVAFIPHRGLCSVDGDELNGLVLYWVPVLVERISP